jgi:hypothetical protein
METRPKDNNVERKVFTLLGNNTLFRERFHTIGRNCNVRRVQAFQVPWVWSKMLGKKENVSRRGVPSTTRLQPKARNYVKKPGYDNSSSSRTIIWRQDFMILFGSGREDITQGRLIE